MMSFKQFYEEALAMVADRSLSVDVEVWNHTRRMTDEPRRAVVAFKLYVPREEGHATIAIEDETPEAVLEKLRHEIAPGGADARQAIAEIGTPQEITAPLAPEADAAEPVAVAAHPHDDVPF